MRVVWLAFTMAGMGRSVPISPAATNIPKLEFQKPNPSEVRSRRDLVTIAAWLVTAAIAAIVLGYLALRLGLTR